MYFFVSADHRSHSVFFSKKKKKPAPYTTGITVTFIFHGLFSFFARSIIILSLLSLSLLLLLNLLTVGFQ